MRWLSFETTGGDRSGVAFANSGRKYKPAQFVMPLILMLHGGGKKLDNLRELKEEASLRELLEMKEWCLAKRKHIRL